MPEGMVLTEAAGVDLAQELLDEGRPFHAHEVLESLWKSTDDAERQRLWQGLAQLAVGLTHAARGNRPGAEALIRRGRDRLAAVPASAAAPVDTGGVVAWAEAWLAGSQEESLRLRGPDEPGP